MPGIGFNLTEIGIIRRIKSNIGCQSVLDSNANITVVLWRWPFTVPCTVLLQLVGSGTDHIGQQFEIVATFWYSGQFQFSGLSKLYAIILGLEHPRVAKSAFTGIDSVHVQQPAVVHLTRISKTFEWNTHFGGPVGIINMRLGIPDSIVTFILAISRMYDNQVSLNSARIDKELVAGLKVPIQIDVDTDKVILKHIIPVRYACPEFGHIRIVTNKGKVEVVVIVGYPSFCFCCRFPTFYWPGFNPVVKVFALFPSIFDNTVDYEILHRMRIESDVGVRGKLTEKIFAKNKV